ncbi:hypothetical protein Nepgr_028048 [Nepenthes gracilis]|uniref:Protein decapping 5 n=1 Tax=Nepenthes gracilis TaxID=150966 RepID=A0AAD3Y3J7_NEPGR|nr:hypothetical protein Nepgr_028048 [Nepenthes gracilis]
MEYSGPIVKCAPHFPQRPADGLEGEDTYAYDQISRIKHVPLSSIAKPYPLSHRTESTKTKTLLFGLSSGLLSSSLLSYGFFITSGTEIMAAEAPKSSSSPDSYIGSLISLTSKSEIRYEGVLYSINTVESSIGLRNVRSFGTEGRKKDGAQVPPSDKVYEYILFRGSDIKDLQVKSSPPVPVQSTSSVDNDPAIIQSHYPHQAAALNSLPSAVSVSSSDVNSQAPQLGHSGSSFQGGLPLYQPGGSLGSWGPSPAPPTANGSGLALPMYWHGFYGPPNGLPHLHQQSLLRPPPGLSMPPSLQQPMQYPSFNPSLPTGGSNLAEIPAALLTTSSNSTILSSTSLPPILPPAPSIAMASEKLPSSMLSKAPNSIVPPMAMSANLPSLSPLTTSGLEASTIIPPVSNMPNAVSGSSLPYQTVSQTSSIVSSSIPSKTETPTPSLMTPDQLMQSGPIPVSSSQSSQIAPKDVEVAQVSSSSNRPMSVLNESQPPILPLPPASRDFHKPNGVPYQAFHAYRARERGRGSGSGSNARAVTRFTEDFDFSAMNEKFRKDEVWGHLGKTNKYQAKVGEGDAKASDPEGSDDEDGDELPQIEIKPVYNKDDFFDTLSCNALDMESQNGRSRFSEQLKIDTETFGDFARNRGYRGGRGFARGGRGGRGSNYSRGYGYAGRGRGRAVPTRAS